MKTKMILGGFLTKRKCRPAERRKKWGVMTRVPAAVERNIRNVV